MGLQRSWARAGTVVALVLAALGCSSEPTSGGTGTDAGTGGSDPGPTVLASWSPESGQGFHGVAVDETYVYWTRSTRVMKVPKLGGDAEEISAGQSDAAGIAVDAENVYWANRGSGN